MQKQPIESINATLAALNRAWRVEPVLGINHAFALSACGPVHPEKLADLADDLGLSDLSELDDYLCPREPWHGLAGFALMGCDTDTDTRLEIEASVAWWAAGKLGLLGMLPTSVRDVHPDIVFLASDR